MLTEKLMVLQSLKGVLRRILSPWAQSNISMGLGEDEFRFFLPPLDGLIAKNVKIEVMERHHLP
jgi:hypothetical protein